MSGSIPGPAGASLLPPSPRCLSTPLGVKALGAAWCGVLGGSWDRGWVKFGDFGVTCAVPCCAATPGLPKPTDFHAACWTPSLTHLLVSPPANRLHFGARSTPQPLASLRAPGSPAEHLPAPRRSRDTTRPSPRTTVPPCPPSHGVLPLSVPPRTPPVPFFGTSGRSPVA